MIADREAARFVVAEQLLNHILSANLGEGEALPSERKLARALFVSRGVLRESLRLLEVQGVIDVRPGRGGGIRIRRPTVDGVARDLALMVRWERTNVSEVIKARQMLEGTCIRELCRSCPPTRLERLHRAASRRGIGQRDYTPYNRFHHILVASANNRVVTQMYRALHRALYCHIQPPPALSAGHHETNVRAHEAIVEAIEARDAEAAQRLLDAHLESHLRYMAPAG